MDGNKLDDLDMDCVELLFLLLWLEMPDMDGKRLDEFEGRLSKLTFEFDDVEKRPLEESPHDFSKLIFSLGLKFVDSLG